MKKKKTKSPSNSRTIPATFLKIYRLSLKIFIIFIFIIAVAIVSLDLQQNLKAKENIDLQRDNLMKELNFWESFIAKHQDYKNAYFQASILEYKLGNSSKAKIYVEKGLALDPNSDDGRKIEQLLSK